MGVSEASSTDAAVPPATGAEARQSSSVADGPSVKASEGTPVPWKRAPSTTRRDPTARTAPETSSTPGAPRSARQPEATGGGPASAAASGVDPLPLPGSG